MPLTLIPSPSKAIKKMSLAVSARKTSPWPLTRISGVSSLVIARFTNFATLPEPS